MTSCVETYRIATWRPEADGKIMITEDTATSYMAEMRPAGEQELKLLLKLARENVELTLKPAEAPYVCPDLKR